MTMKKNNATFRIAGIILLWVIGINALFAGAALILQPDGRLLGFPAGLLRHSPFDDFFIPGIVLFLFNGISSVVIAVMAYRKNRYYSRLISVQGIVLLGWLIMQILFLRSVNGLQITLLAMGVFLIIIGEYIDEIVPG